MAVPPIALFMCRHPMVSHFNLSSITEAMCAAAPIGESLTEEFMDKFKIPIFQGKCGTHRGVNISPMPILKGFHYTY